MTAAYGWVITRDSINGGPGDTVPSRVGTMGPHDIPDDIVSQLQAGKGQPFKMYDDDGILYYSGRYIGPDDEDMFGPLDDFGTPDAGAVTIKYRDGKTGAYETL